MGPFKNNYGAASSPILVGDLVILNQDHDEGSFLLAVDKNTGETAWRIDRSEFPRGFSTPIVRTENGQTQIVVVGALRAIGYDAQTGDEIWTLHGLSRISTKTPVIGPDGTMYFTEWAPGGDEGSRIQADPFDKMINEYDKNENGTLERKELPVGPLQIRFPQIDRDKNQSITQAEYEWMERIFNSAQNVVVAVKAGGVGDITQSHILWKRQKFLPYVPSPIYYNGELIMVKNGGILTAFDAATGETTNQGRLPHRGNYYSSPIAGDGKLYLLSQKGGLTVLQSGADWEVMHKAKFGEEIYATPAMVDGRIYLRTSGHLYCFWQSRLVRSHQRQKRRK